MAQERGASHEEHRESREDDVGQGVAAVTAWPFALIGQAGTDAFQPSDQGLQDRHAAIESKITSRRQANSSADQGKAAKIRELSQVRLTLWVALRLPGPTGGPKAIQERDAVAFRTAVDAYEGSAEWRQLKDSTKADYRKFLPIWRERYGERRVATIDRAAVLKIRARHAETSSRRGNKSIAVLSVLLSWAVDHGLRPNNPALGPKRLKVTGGYSAWTDDEIEAFLL